ncbi:MAG: hypothetical protein GEU96_15200 [Propionibacteriales bacterium]|nr:hypothetical protein [Propionibacteriales bacterium]
MNQHDGLYEAAGERRGEQRALILLGVVGLAMALILGAFSLGRVVSDDQAGSVPPTADPTKAAKVEAGSLAEAALGGNRKPAKKKPSSSPKATATPVIGEGELKGRGFQGPVRVIKPHKVIATCRSKAGVDAGGDPVTYQAGNTNDGSAQSAWRCDGTGEGVMLTYRFPSARRIAEVGLIPGYAKTDPVDGTDRYAENRRIKRVRWTFDGGRFIEQRFNTSASVRRMQAMRIPMLKSRTVKLTILSSSAGKRRTIAISETRFAGPDD